MIWSRDEVPSMAEMVPVLIGTAGMVSGEMWLLADASPIVLGRSRSCDISLRRAPGYLKSPATVRDSDHDFNTVSRRHARIEIKEGSATIEDLSTNGTFCNGESCTGMKTVDLRGSTLALRLGTRETFDLCLVPIDDPRIQGMRPVQAGANAGSGD